LLLEELKTEFKGLSKEDQAEVRSFFDLLAKTVSPKNYQADGQEEGKDNLERLAHQKHCRLRLSNVPE